MLKIGIIGYGYWGPNLVRNFTALNNCKITYCCDLDEKKLKKAKTLYPFLKTTTKFDVLLKEKNLDAIVIATPPATHFELANKALQKGKHVFVEKPLTTSTNEASNLIKIAKKEKLTLMVDHVFVYNPAVQKIKVILEKEMRKPYYYYSIRTNLGIFQNDVNVIWDLAIHDISIADYLFNKKPYAVSATGVSHFKGGLEDIAYLTLFYKNKFMVHTHVSWLAPTKIRQIIIAAAKKMIIYNDLNLEEKIKIYDKGVINQRSKIDPLQIVWDYRVGDIYSPHIELTEALKFACNDFIESIERDKKPLADGESGLRVVKILEAAQESIQKKGKLVQLTV